MSARRRHVDVGLERAPQLRRCRVHSSVTALRHDYGRNLVPGELVDLDEPVAPGVTLRDLVRDAWFDQPNAPTPPIEVPTDAPSPAPSEEHD